MKIYFVLFKVGESINLKRKRNMGGQKQVGTPGRGRQWAGPAGPWIQARFLTLEAQEDVRIQLAGDGALTRW